MLRYVIARLGTLWTSVVEASRSLCDLLLCHGHDVDCDAVELYYLLAFMPVRSLPRGTVLIRTYAHRLQQVLRLLIHIQHATLAVLCEVQRRDLWHVLILPLTLLFLQLEGDASDWATLNALHQMGGVAGDLCERILANTLCRRR